MPNNQLRWHLLNEMSEILVENLELQNISPSPICYIDKYRWNITPLTNLLLSGKGPADTVRKVIAPGIELSDNEPHGYDITIELNGHEGFIEPIYFKKLALRWARFIDICGGDYDDDVTPEYLTILREHNSVEKIHARGYSETNFEVIRACHNLSHLIGDQSIFRCLFDLPDVTLPKTRIFEIVNLNLHAPEFKKVLAILANHPERCPNLERLTITRSIFYNDGLSKLSQCVPSKPLLTVKSLNVTLRFSSRPSDDISNMAVFLKAFPNIENVRLTLNAEYENAESMKPVQMFNDLKSNFNFELNYNLKIHKNLPTDAAVNRFYEDIEKVMAGYETNDSVVKRRRGVEYVAVKSYSMKTMKFELKAWPRSRFADDERRFFFDDDGSDDSDGSFSTNTGNDSE